MTQEELESSHLEILLSKINEADEAGEKF